MPIKQINNQHSKLQNVLTGKRNYTNLNNNKLITVSFLSAFLDERGRFAFWLSLFPNVWICVDKVLYKWTVIYYNIIISSTYLQLYDLIIVIFSVSIEMCALYRNPCKLNQFESVTRFFFVQQIIHQSL